MKKYFVIESMNKKTDLNGVIWQKNNAKSPKAILQIVHGMAEYIERYEPFAEFLAENNILVVGHDHLGHGESVDIESPLLGYIAKENGSEILVEDTYQITNYIKKRYPDCPYFILGHSMGALIVRSYLKKYSDKVNGAILMGICGKKEDVLLTKRLLKTLNTISPKAVNPAFYHLIFNRFNKKIKQPISANAWLSKNEDNVLKFNSDNKCGFIYTNNGFFTLITLIEDATKKNWFKSIRKDLPIYLVSGENDPLGNYGKTPRKLAVELTNNYFSDVTLSLYRDLRHEILNEQEKDIVFSDIYNWLTCQIKETH